MLTCEQRTLVENYLPLANKLAGKKSKPRHVTYAELQSAAYLGLCDYASRYESGTPFVPHARILGEMGDYLRSLGWGAKKGPSPTVEYTEFLDYVAPCSSKEGPDIEELLSGLAERDKAILMSKYIDEKPLREIAIERNMSIGNVSIILKKCREAVLHRAA